MAAQPVAEPVELSVLQIPQLRVAERATPEADLDLRLQVAPVIQRERLQHDGPQRRQSGEPGGGRGHPGADPAVRVHEGRPEDVCLAVEVVTENAARAVRLLGDSADGGSGDAVAGDHPPGGGQDFVPPLIPVNDLGHRTSRRGRQPVACSPCFFVGRPSNIRSNACQPGSANGPRAAGELLRAPGRGRARRRLGGQSQRAGRRSRRDHAVRRELLGDQPVRHLRRHTGRGRARGSGDAVQRAADAPGRLRRDGCGRGRAHPLGRGDRAVGVRDELPAVHYAITGLGGPVRVAAYTRFGSAAWPRPR